MTATLPPTPHVRLYLRQVSDWSREGLSSPDPDGPVLQFEAPEGADNEGEWVQYGGVETFALYHRVGPWQHITRRETGPLWAPVAYVGPWAGDE